MSKDTRQVTPPGIAKQWPTLLLIKLGRITMHRFTAALEPFGIRQRHVAALIELRDGGELTQQTLCGHLHPGVRIHGSGGETARLPCFVIGNRRAILPAFGRFTGLAEFARDPREMIVVVAGGALFTLPPAADDGVVKLQRR